MYGYASELLPYLAGLLGQGGNQPMQLPGAQLADSAARVDNNMRGLAQTGAGLMAASRKGQTKEQRGQALANAPLPPRRPNEQGPEMPQGLLGAENLPRIDNGPAATTPQGPTWTPNAPAPNVPLPPQRPQMGPQLSEMTQGLPPALLAALANLPKGPTYMSAPGAAPVMRSNNPLDNLPKGPTTMSAGPGGFGNGSSINDPFLAKYLYGVQ